MNVRPSVKAPAVPSCDGDRSEGREGGAVPGKEVPCPPPAGRLESDGGRPQELLRVTPGHGYAIGVDVGETRIRAGLFDLAMVPAATAEFPLPAGRGRPAQVAEHIVRG